MNERKQMAADMENGKQFRGLKTLVGFCVYHSLCAFRHVHLQEGRGHTELITKVAASLHQ